MYSSETVQSFLNRSRLRLDQELDNQTNFWSDAEMLEYMNEGMREVWQSVRENHQNWFMRQVTSRDGVLTIGSKKYDTKLLQLVSGRTRLLLPPDFYELTLLEGLRPTVSALADLNNHFFPQVVFEYANITQHAFRNRIVDTVTQGIRRYRYDIIFGPEGPYIYVAPNLSVVETIDTQIAYVSMPQELPFQGSFEGTGFTGLMVDAVLAYTTYAAVKKEDLTENLATFKEHWRIKQELCSRAAGPKQTRDVETVENSYIYQEEDI